MEIKRMSVTLLPEWEDELDKLKKEKFYDKPKSEMIRFLIELGIEKSKQPKQPSCHVGDSQGQVAGRR